MSSDTLITSAHRRGKRRIASREYVDSKRCRVHSSREGTVNPRARSRRDENNKRDENCVEEQCEAPLSHRETPETTQAGMLNNFIEPLRKIFGRRNTGLSYAEESPASAAGDTDKEPPLTGPSGCTSSKDGSVTSEGESNREESIKDVLQQAATEAPLEEIERVSTDQGPSTSSREEEGVEDDEDENAEFDPFYFMKHLPPLSECVPRYRQSILPPRTRRCKRKTLVLDLDETLVHSSLEHMQDCHFTFPVFFNNNQHTVFVRQRPHLLHFMQQVAALYEVVVFTASQAIYAEKLLNILDPARKLIRHRIYRDSCVYVDGTYLKDLSVLGRELGNTVIVDNSPQAFGFQVENGIPIESWYDDASDQELLHLLPFLQHLADVEDVRPYIVRGFGIHELIARA